MKIANNVLNYLLHYPDKVIDCVWQMLVNFCQVLRESIQNISYKVIIVETHHCRRQLLYHFIM